MELYNTLKRRYQRVEDVAEGKKIKMYVCGITAYDHSHIGHARSAVVFDTLRRYLEYRGFEVVYVQNFTDVDDKIIRRAVSEGKTQKEIAEKFIEEYLKDIEELNVRKADYHPKVTDHINEIIGFIEKLVEMGFGYVVDGDVYFHVPAFSRYGELSRQSLEELNRHRIEPDERKKDIKDFALWKSAKEDDIKAEAVFDSPWGKGRPGWHIECSVLSSHYLGVPFEIHGGGKDLIFPHHENERAQSYALFGVEPVKLWVHNDFVTVKGEKMSKSLGNIISIRDVVEKHGGEVLRYFLLTAHYRSPIDYSEENIERAKKAYDYLKTALVNMDMEIAALKAFGDRDTGIDNKKIENEIDKFKKSFEKAMDNDLNTPKALAVLHRFAGFINKVIFNANLFTLTLIFETYRELCSLLGLFEKYRRVPELDEKEIMLIKEREKARKEKNFEKADKIRDMFKEKGIQLIDTPHGTRWRYLNP
jgi:cysteinyl-tRNA synthetase